MNSMPEMPIVERETEAEVIDLLKQKNKKKRKAGDSEKLELFWWIEEYGNEKLFGPLKFPITQRKRNDAWESFFTRSLN